PLELAEEHVPEVPPVFRGARVLLVAADVPDVPFRCERKRLALRERLALAPLRGADCCDARLDLGRPFTDANLCFGWTRSGRHGGRGLSRHAVEAQVVHTYILRDALAALG